MTQSNDKQWLDMTEVLLLGRDQTIKRYALFLIFDTILIVKS